MSKRQGSPSRHSGLGPLPVALVAVACTFLALAACGGAPVVNSTGGAPKPGGTFTVTVGEPMTLDPAIDWDQSGADVEQTLFETLYDYAPNSGAAGDKLEPVLAAAMPEVSGDGLTYTIPLRRGVHFAPPVNRELTASDVRYSFERMLRLPTAPGTSYYESIVGVPDFIAGKGAHVAGFRILDPYTIQVRLSQRDPTLLFKLAMEFCDVLPREWVKKWGTKIGRHPLGSGPFMFENWAPGRAVTVKRNPNYWDAGHVWLDEIKFEVGYGPERDLMRVERGEIDCTWLSQTTYVQVKDNPQFKQGLTEMAWAAVDYLILNTQMKPFDDVRVRQALNWAIDREKIARVDGNYAMWQIYPRGLPGYDPEAKFYGYDPAKARSLLAAAGYPNGFATTLYVPATPSQYAAQWGQMVQNDLEAVGIHIKLQVVPPQLYFARAATPQTYPMSFAEWAMDYPDPYDWVHMCFSRDMAVKGGSNSSFWWDPQLETMIAHAQRTLDPAARVGEFGTMQQYISEQAPVVPTDSMIWATLTGPHVGGFYLHPVYVIDAAHYWHK